MVENYDGREVTYTQHVVYGKPPTQHVVLPTQHMFEGVHVSSTQHLMPPTQHLIHPTQHICLKVCCVCICLCYQRDVNRWRDSGGIISK